MNHESANYLTYYNINWKKYLHVFNAYDNIQGIFLIHSTLSLITRSPKQITF